MKAFVLVISCLLYYCCGTVQAQTQKDSVTLEIIGVDSTLTKINLNWPYKGPPNIGSNEELIKTIYMKLSENDVECPPERIKISENIWKCGNGKKIKTNDKRLARILALEWDK